MKRILFPVLSIVLCVAMFSVICSAQKLPAFPGAEGFGMYTTGGRGGKVLKVTNLNDSGEGSLRAAVEASGARIVVFDISGTIQLKSKLIISNDSITIAGQTAPGDGICIRDYNVYVTADNVIIRYMRFRLGDETNQEDDAFGGRGSVDVIIDHCSMSWSTDECVSFYQNQNFTMQWCLIGESLRNSVHSKGSHGYGGIWGGEKASFHHNLLANHSSRNPRFSGSRYDYTDLELVDFRNNVIYNWEYNSAYGAEGGNYNLVNNYYKYGPATNEKVKSRIIHADTDNGENTQSAGVHGIFYVNGNYVHGDEAVTGNNWNGGVQWDEEAGLKTEDLRSETEFNNANIFTDNPEQAYTKVLDYVGASLFRDAVDERTIHDVQNGTATITDGGKGSTNGIIDTQSAVGGWPELKSSTAPIDSDEDGMPDDWEDIKGLDKNNPNDANVDRNNDGYTNIEEYINNLAISHYNTAPLIRTDKPQKNKVLICKADTSVMVDAYINDYNGGSITNIKLFFDNELLQEFTDTNRVNTIIENVAHGRHTLTIVATDNSGRQSEDKTEIFVGKQEVRITIEEVLHGDVELEPSGGIYVEGITVKATAKPMKGYRFIGWTKDIETTKNELQIKTDIDLTLKPVFILDPDIKNIWSYPIKINFLPKEDYDEVVGYMPDNGQIFGKKNNGYSYGWLEDNNWTTGFNNSQPGVWHTFKRFENSNKKLNWGIDVPKGIYRVRLGLGGKVGFYPNLFPTELRIKLEGVLIEDTDGIDLFDEHVVDSIAVTDGQLTLSSIDQSRICFIEIELLELTSTNTLTINNGLGSGEYDSQLNPDVLIVANTPEQGMEFDKWTGNTGYVEDIYAASTFVNMSNSNIMVTATYKPVTQQKSHNLIVLTGHGSGFYAPGTIVEITTPDSVNGACFLHWEYECTEPVSFDSTSRNILVSMPNTYVVFEPVYHKTATGTGDIYQAEEANLGTDVNIERACTNYYGIGYVNFTKAKGSYLEFNNVDGKEGGSFIIKLRYSLNDKDRQGDLIVNNNRTTIVMPQTKSWTDWQEIEASINLQAGTNNTIRVETTGDDLGYFDQIELIKQVDTNVNTQISGSEFNLSLYPNPFENSAILSFELEKSSEVSIQLFDIRGMKVKELTKGFYPAGVNNVRINRENLNAGIYILFINTEKQQKSLKVMIQ